MASFLARPACRRICVPSSLLRPVPRNIHSSSVVLKKKRAISSSEALSFDDEGPAVDIFAEDSTVRSTPSSTSASAAKQNISKKRHTKLTSEVRIQRFEELYNFVSLRLGKRPSVKTPQVRKSAWVHLIGLSNSEAELQKVVDLLPGWKDGGLGDIPPSTVELFVRRCSELRCPNLALSVFGNYGKYSLQLTLPAARQLIHSFSTSSSSGEIDINSIIAVSALYDIYKLPPISQDLVSCALLTSACMRYKSKDSLVVADALLPFLKEQLGPLKKSELVAAEEEGKKAVVEAREAKWVDWTVRNIQSALAKRFGKKAEEAIQFKELVHLT